MLENEQIKPEQGWSEDLLQKYTELALLSLYDYLLSQEKLVIEIRKQNKELRMQSEKIQSVRDSISMLADCCDKLSEKMDDVCENSFCETDHSMHSKQDLGQTQELLMQSLDSLLNQIHAAAEMKKNILHLLPERSGFWNSAPPVWRGQIEQLIEGYCRGVGTIHDKIIASLADLDIEVLIPQINDPFLPQKHRAIEQVSGSPSRMIAKVIRYGYMQEGKILRYADVAVFQ